MAAVTSSIVFFVIWWVVLFAVLPWGVKTVDTPEKGHASSAPTHPRILLKFGITTLISLVLWWGVLEVVEARLVSFEPTQAGQAGTS